MGATCLVQNRSSIHGSERPVETMGGEGGGATVGHGDGVHQRVAGVPVLVVDRIVALQRVDVLWGGGAGMEPGKWWRGGEGWRGGLGSGGTIPPPSSPMVGNLWRPNGSTKGGQLGAGLPI